MSYQAGQKIRLQASFKNSEGQLADPTTVAFKSKVGAAPIQTWTSPITHVSTGVYEYVLLLSAPGTWTVGCIGTGDVEALREASFGVLPSVLFP